MPDWSSDVNSYVSAELPRMNELSGKELRLKGFTILPIPAGPCG